MQLTKHLHLVLCILYALLTGTRLFAQQIDTTYNQKIKEYTTDIRFLPSSILNLVDDPVVPSPRKFFGEIIGAPGVMHHTTEIYNYFKKLSESSRFLSMQQVGTSEEGRAITLVIISSKENISQLDHYKRQLSLLADPRAVGTMDVQQIIGTAKPVYYLSGGLHSPEMGSPEMLMELAYRLITSQQAEIKKILDNVIILINPVQEPDGRDKQVDWYYRYTKARKEWDDGFRRAAPYWGKYAYHDNNRDAIQLSQALTKTTLNVYFEWHPSVMLDLHESVPLIYMSTGTGPYNETIDPITISEWQVMANHDITVLTVQGLPGAFTWAYYDGWAPVYDNWIGNNHNSVSRFYETFGNAGANTYLRDINERKFADDEVTSCEWYRPDPATRFVIWSSRNNINYTEAAVLASLSYVAENAKMVLENFFQKGLNSIRKGKEEKPRAFVIPASQHDPVMTAFLINQLRKQKIEVHRVDSGNSKNTYVVLLDQPYRNLAVTLLSKQNFPKEAKFPPYDDIAWTLGYLYGVDVKAEDSLKYSPASLQLLKEDVKYEGMINGNGINYVLNYNAQSTLLPALYWLNSENKNAAAIVLDTKSKLDDIQDTLAAGSVLFKNISASQAKQIAMQFGLDLRATKNNINDKQHQVTLPRVAIYHTWYYTQDAGWARYTFDQSAIPYTYINKDDLRKGGLRKRFDVILIPRTTGTANDFINEIDKKFGPMPYTKTADYLSHGFLDATADMTGGPGYTGMEQLQQFVETGGVIVSLDNSSSILATTGIAADLKPYDATGLFHPGSVVNAKVRNANNPILYGYPEVFPIFKGNGPLLQVQKYNRNMILLQYGTQPLKDEEKYTGPIMGVPGKKETLTNAKDTTKKEVPYVLSGMVRNEQAIIGHGAIFNVPVGAGRVIAFTFDPLHCYLNLHDASLVWNVLINWDYLKN